MTSKPAHILQSFDFSKLISRRSSFFRIVTDDLRSDCSVICLTSVFHFRSVFHSARDQKNPHAIYTESSTQNSSEDLLSSRSVATGLPARISVPLLFPESACQIPRNTGPRSFCRIWSNPLLRAWRGLQLHHSRSQPILPLHIRSIPCCPPDAHTEHNLIFTCT